MVIQNPEVKQQIEEARQQLNLKRQEVVIAKQEAQKQQEQIDPYLNISIPQRKYKSGISKAQQLQIFETRKRAREYNIGLQESKQKITSAEEQIKASQSYLDIEEGRISDIEAEYEFQQIKDIERAELTKKFNKEHPTPIQTSGISTIPNIDIDSLSKYQVPKFERGTIISPTPQIPESAFISSDLVVSSAEPKDWLSKVESSLKEAQFKGGASGFFGSFAIPFVETGKFVKGAVTSPIETILGVTKGVGTTSKRIISGEGFPEFTEFIKGKPEVVTGRIAGEVILFGASSKAIRTASRLGEVSTTLINPKFKSVERFGEREFIRLPSSIPERDVIDITLIEGIPQKTLKQQSFYAGKTLDLVSAQKSLFKVFEEKKVISKPLTFAKGKLEASFFASPDLKLRLSRLGLESQKEANILDVFYGKAEIGFKRVKPQAIIIEKAKVEAIPKSLKKLLAKAETGDRQATLLFQEKYLKYQLRPTGKFKSIGYATTKEAELTLAPQETLTKKSVVGVSLIKGRKVEFISAEVKSLNKELSLLSKKAVETGLTKEEAKRLSKETGLSYYSKDYLYYDVKKLSYPFYKTNTYKLYKPKQITYQKIIPYKPTTTKTFKPNITYNYKIPYSYKPTGYKIPDVPLIYPYKEKLPKRPPIKRRRPQFEKDIIGKTTLLKKERIKEIKTYTPDFSSQALQLTKTLTPKEVGKLKGRRFTGLELRKVIIIK